MKYLKVFTDFYDMVEALDDAECGRLFRAMLLYAADAAIDEVDLEGNERFIWPCARINIDRTKEEVDKRAENGRAGGRPRKQTEANESNQKQPETTESRKEKKGKKDVSAYADTPLLSPAAEHEKLSTFSDEMQSALKEWLAYKAEKRQAYKATGLKAFLTEAANNVRKYGEKTVAESIRMSMASNYQGVVWNKAVQNRGSPACAGDGWTYSGQRRYNENDLAGIAVPLDGG